MIKDDEYLERIVAGIQSVTTENAKVLWNETLNDRQFDVTIRFQLGTLSYLVLVEVKNKTRKAEASDIEAFVTKSRDQNASKAVFVTAAGYQAGAIKVAERHGVDIFTVGFDDTDFNLPPLITSLVTVSPDAPPNFTPELSIGDSTLMICIYSLTVHYVEGDPAVLSMEPGAMQYYAKQTKLGDGALEDIIQSAKFDNPILGEKRMQSISLNTPATITPPDSYFLRQGVATCLDLHMEVHEGRPLLGNIDIDPLQFTQSVIYTNVQTGEEARYNLSSLPLGPRRVSSGKFYQTLHPQRYFYCDGIVGDSIRWHLIEGFDHATLIRATFSEDVSHSSHYVPVTDKKTLQRLRSRLADYNRLNSKPQTLWEGSSRAKMAVIEPQKSATGWEFQMTPWAPKSP